MSLGRVVGILVVLLALYAIITQPLSSAAMVRGGGDALQSAGTSVIEFVRGVAPSSGSAGSSRSSGSSSGSYTVRPGDTLSSIAARTGTSVNSLLARNDLADRDLIIPGQRLSLR